MKRNTIVYNERAWAMDVVSEINRWSAERSRCIRSAGGEWGISTRDAGSMLFPDILLFGDIERASVLQGWELKMPDTPVTDTKLIDNAKLKADRLGLTSFVLWNGRDAALHKIQGAGSVVVRVWHERKLGTREALKRNRLIWQAFLSGILEDTCDFLENDSQVLAKPLPEKLTEIVAVILQQSCGILCDEIKKEYGRSKAWRTHVASWWADACASYTGRGSKTSESERFSRLASEILLHWIHRFLFAHYLRRFASEAAAVNTIKEGVSIQEAEAIFATLSRKRDYAQVFKTREGANLLPAPAWSNLLAFNTFLQAVRLPEIDQHLLHESLQNVMQSSQRKLAGQFSTPLPLARLLVSLTADDLNSPILDPCCGTGTIARAVLDCKIDAGISPRQAIKTTFASDLHAMQLQFATVALALGESPFETIRVFQQDALCLRAGKTVSFIDAETGLEFEETLPSFPCVVVNPPFVRFEEWQKATEVQDLFEKIEGQTGIPIDKKSDYFAIIILSIADLLPPGGRLGAIFPNSWLGTHWAENFRKQLRALFHIETVVTSGSGRWFPNADVVTTLTVLQKRESKEKGSDEIVFATTCKPISDWDFSSPSTLLDSRRRRDTDTVARTILTVAQITELERHGFNWTAFFTDLSWWKHLQNALVPAKTLFKMARGERRGWDAMFYPPVAAGIESIYLKPVLKTTATIKRLCTKPNAAAFCCSRTMDELKALKHAGALAWINKFQTAFNGTGRPLPECLKRAGCLWYEMRPDTLADLAVSINPGKRLFFVKLTQRAFVNQRLACLIAKESTDLELSHALLCSLVGCLYLEAIGFGRGLGALDLSATRLNKKLWMLDPSHVTAKHKQKILSSFAVLASRNILEFDKELDQADRLAFEKAVLSAFGLGHLLTSIKQAALDLYSIRNTVRG